LGLKKLVLTRKRNGRWSERGEKISRITVEVFWRKKMNGRQRDQGVDVTEPPEIEFLSHLEAARLVE
jgi:hypothetical protein